MSKSVGKHVNCFSGTLNIIGAYYVAACGQHALDSIR